MAVNYGLYEAGVFRSILVYLPISCFKSVRETMTWSDCVKADMNACSLGGIDPQNRTAWRSGIRSISRLLPTPATGTTAAVEK